METSVHINCDVDLSKLFVVGPGTGQGGSAAGTRDTAGLVVGAARTSRTLLRQPELTASNTTTDAIRIARVYHTTRNRFRIRPARRVARGPRGGVAPL